jgi:hypothetical protein
MAAKIVPERAGLTAAQTRDVHYDSDLRGLQTRARFDSLAGEGVTTAGDELDPCDGGDEPDDRVC